MIKLFSWVKKKTHSPSFTEFVGNQNIKWIGNSYGGFFVDISLLGINSIVVSVGIGEDISFDRGIYEMGVQRIFMFDPTPKAKIFIDKQDLPTQFRFFEMALSTEDAEMDMYLPKNKNYVSGSLVMNKNIDANDFVKVKCITVSTICSIIENKHIDLLKIDIEGSEYEVLENIMQVGIYPKQICVEFHNRFFKDGDQKFKSVVNKLQEKNYRIMGISNTNEEFLFIHNVSE
jgi:FkbM family methyltransferase